MSKQIKISKKPVLPWYLAGTVFLLAGILLPIYRLWGLLAAAVLSAAAFVLAARLCPAREIVREVPFFTGHEDADAMLNAMDEKLRELAALNKAIPDAQLSAAMDRMEKAGRGIMEQVEKDPAKARQARRFANYYLVDAVKILGAYAQLDKQGVKGENSARMRTEIEANAATIATAFENQLDSLYQAAALDIDTDLEVLQGMLKGQGLTH